MQIFWHPILFYIRNTAVTSYSRLIREWSRRWGRRMWSSSPPINTSKIYLHAERFLQNAHWFLAEGSRILKGQEYLPVTSLDKRERNQNGPCMSRRELMTKVPAFWEVPSSVWRLARLEGELWSLEESTVKDLPNRDLHNLTADCAAALSPPDGYVSFEADRGWCWRQERTGVVCTESLQGLERGVSMRLLVEGDLVCPRSEAPLLQGAWSEGGALHSSFFLCMHNLSQQGTKLIPRHNCTPHTKRMISSTRWGKRWQESILKTALASK